MGRSQQRKGRSGEKELSEILCQYGYQVCPGTALNFGTEPDLSGLDGIHIECKRNEHLNLYDAMAQSERDSQRFKDGAPAVFHRRNRKRWLVSMFLEDWLRLYQKGEENE